MDGALLLLVIAGVGAFVWLRFKRRRAEAEQIAWSQLVQAVEQQFPYYEDVHPFKDAEVKAWMAAGGLTHAVEQIKERYLSLSISDDLVVNLGDRPPDLSPGVQIEVQLDEMGNGAESTAEYRHLQEQHRIGGAALKPWHAVADVGSFPVFLPRETRARHTYVLGKTGSGKSTLLKWMAFQDAQAGNGFALLTPEAETIEELIPYLPEARVEDTIYFNPADARCRWHLNPFWLAEGEDFDRKAESVFTLLLRLVAEDTSPRVQQILRNAVYALLDVEGTTLLDLPPLLDRTDGTYRAQLITKLQDPETRAFWRSGYETLPVNAHLPITTRLVPFLRPQVIRRALCRPGQGNPFRFVID